MITLTPTQSLQDTQDWLQTSVQSFFTHCNWENQSRPAFEDVAEIAAIASTDLDPGEALSFNLRVRQFFAAMNWDGTATTPVEEGAIDVPSLSNEDFTLTDFSDLF